MKGAASQLLFVLVLLLPTDVVAMPDWIPPGFESLTQPQRNDVDVIYGGERITTAFARFTEDTVTFLDPAAVAAAIPDVIDRASLAEILGTGLPANAGVDCGIAAGDCPLDDVDGISILFDRSRLRVRLAIPPDRLSRISPPRDGFLPPSDGGLSLVSRLTGNMSGANDDGTAWSLGSRSLLAWRENHLEVRARVDGEGSTHIDTFAFRRQFGGREWAAGRFRSSTGPFAFLGSELMTGVSTGTSLDTRIDQRYALGSPVEIFLPSRSRVEIWRGDELLDAGYYDVGNQRLDTTRLPGGAYTVGLRVIDAAGSVTTTERFFSRSARLPPVSGPSWFVEAGRLEEIGTATTAEAPGTFRAGINWRVADALGAGIGVSAVDGSTMIEFSGFHQGARHEWQASLAAAAGGSVGVDLRGRYRFDGASLNVNLRRIAGAQSGQFRPLERNAMQFSTSLNLASGFGSFNLFHRLTRADDSPVRHDTGLRWRLVHGASDRGRLLATAELSSNDGKAAALMTLNWQLGRSDRSRSATLRVTDSGLGVEAAARRSFAAARDGRHSLEWRVASDPVSSVGARVDSRTQQGTANWDIRYQPGTNTLGYTGHFATNLVVADGRVAAGGADNRAAGFLVRVDGPHNNDATLLPVLVNGIERARVRPGEQVFVEANPFRRHTVDIGRGGDTLVRIDGGRHDKILYPGNVVAVDWSVRDTVVLIGKVVDDIGTPLADAVIENGDHPVTTDVEGRFQIEVDRSEASLLLTRGGSACEAPVEVPAEGPVGFTGIITCMANLLTAAVKRDDRAIDPHTRSRRQKPEDN